MSTIMVVSRGQCQRVSPPSPSGLSDPGQAQPPITPPALQLPSRSLEKPEDVLKPLSPSKNQTKMCRVCEENSASHRHYGGHSCLSCKAFFRRAVTSSKRERVCKFRKIPDTEELCSVKKCAACRYRKCRDSGMMPEMVLSGKKEALKHVGRVNKVQKKIWTHKLDY